MFTQRAPVGALSKQPPAPVAQFDILIMSMVLVRVMAMIDDHSHSQGSLTQLVNGHIIGMIMFMYTEAI